MRPGRLPARVVLATGNAGKLREMREILAPWDVEVRSLDVNGNLSASKILTLQVTNTVATAPGNARIC